MQNLLGKEISNNWVVDTGLTLAEAKEKWPLGVAVGKLNIVFAEGKDPRVVLDSAVCQANTRCYLSERLSVPMASDVAMSTQPEDMPGAFIGASLDFKAAHKQIQVRPDEHGLLLFAFKKKLYHYRVCDFGGRFSAYWWQRAGAFLLRQVHGLLSWQPHKAFLFVDDLLCACCEKKHQKCLPWWCCFSVQFRHPCPGKRCNFKIAWFGVGGS